MSWADLVQESLKEGKVEGRKQRKTHKTTEMAENNLYTIIKVFYACFPRYVVLFVSLKTCS